MTARAQRWQCQRFIRGGRSFRRHHAVRYGDDLWYQSGGRGGDGSFGPSHRDGSNRTLTIEGEVGGNETSSVEGGVGRECRVMNQRAGGMAQWTAWPNGVREVMCEHRPDESGKSGRALLKVTSID
jgi:hypothetical protein